MSNRSKLCVILVLAFLCPSAWAGIGYVQGAHSTASFGSGSVSLTNTQAGDTILVAVFVNIGGTISPPTDTQNNTWTADTNYYSPNSFNTGMQIWRASNIAGGSDTITVRQSNSGTVGNALVSVNAYEYSGLATSSPVDGVYAESSGCGTASGAAGSIATSNANDLIFVFFADPGGSALSAGSGFTQRDNFTTSGDPMLAEDDIVSSTGIYAGTATVGGSLGCNQGMMVAYKAAGAVSAGMAYVQGAHSSASYGAGSVSFTTTLAGDTILVAVFVNIGGTINPPTDTQNNTWTADTNYYSANSFNTGMQIWRASNIAGGSDTITVQQSNSGAVGNALVSVNAYEYSGLAISSPVDGVYAESYGCGTTSGTTGPVTTTNANDLLFAFFADPGRSPLSSGSGFTPRDSFITDGNPMLVEHEIVSSTGTYTGTAIVGGSLGCNEGMMVAYKAAAGAISGVIGGTGGSGATVTLSGGASATVNANSSGAYTFSGLASGSYTVTPSKTGFAFTPASQNVIVNNANVTGVNFSTVTYTLSGTISGAGGSGATVTLSGAASATVTANSSGAYTFPGLANGSYTVTPSKTGFAFTPASQNVTVSGANVTGVNFSTVTYTLSGTISGPGGNGATVTLSGAASATVTANVSGAYTFTGLANGSYTVTPSLSGFSFTPASQNVTVSSANVTAVNFSTVTYTLSGTISGPGGNGATVTLSGAGSATVTTNSSGAYTFTGLVGGSYTVTPSLSGFSFTPASQNVTVSNANVTGVNFSTVTYTLSGTISGAGGNGATVTLSGAASATVTANASGAYTFTGLVGGSYTVTPSLSGFAFSPASQIVTVSNANVTGVNFSTVTYTLSGTISGPGGNGATVTLSGAASATVTANSSGAYTFTGLASGSYTVTPSLSGFAFTPASQNVTVSNANVTGVNFSTVTYTLSGTISGAGGSGATVTLSGAASATVTANSSGAYTFTGLVGGSYTVTPSLSGFSFTPASQNVTVSNANVTSVNFSTVTYTLSGTISGPGGSGATVTLSGAASAIVTANSSGAYTFTGLASGSYTVTPSLSGFSFTPASQIVTVSNANVTGVNFSTVTYTLSGTISGAGGSGATATLSGAASASTTADASGNYSFSGLANGSYTVTPSKTGFTFSPISQAVTVTGANQSAVNFTASAVTYALSGTISPSASGAGASVTLTQGSTTIATVTADSNGNYTFNAVANGSYTVTPTKSGYSCTPASQSVAVNGAPVTGVNFTASALSIYTISGSLSPSANGSAATVTLSGAASATTTADASGNFSFSGLANGSYTVAASKAGFAISPASQAVTVSGASVTGVNFTASITFAIDAVAYGDNNSAGTSVATSAFSTTSANELLLAFIATDASSSGITVTGVSGGGLTWALVRRTNAQMGTAEVWRAFAPSQFSNLSVTATLSQRVASSVTVVSFMGTDTSGSSGSGAIGATASGSASSGAPTATVITTRNNSWVLGVGDDWDKATARTLGANQTMIHQLLSSSGDTFWVQRQNSATPSSGTSVTISDTAPTSDRYDLTIVEVLPAAAGVTTYGISGTLSPSAQGSGATVTLSGTASGTTTADSSGNYAFTGLANGSYTVTPTKSGTVITPASQTVTVNGASITAVNFSVTVPIPTWSLSGNLSPAASGSGTTLTLGGASSSTTTANSSGNYTFSGLVNGTYSVTPSKSGYVFNPAAQSATISSANVGNANFTVSVAPIAVSISPASVSLVTGGVQQFTATVTGTSNTSVTWTATGGTVTSSGLYTAPSTPGGYTVKATSVADTTKSASATVTVTTASSSTVLLGDQNVETQVGSIPSGQAEAFQATAAASGTMQSLVVYLDSTSTASQLAVGLYADASGHPGALLSQGSSTTPVAGAWNPILVPAASLASGTPYWIAILGTTSGNLAFRDATLGSCASEINAQSSLPSLPPTWTTGTVGSNCPASVFGDSTKVVFYDTFAGTTISPYWTAISRHGEYSQSETECNVPSMVSVNNGLTITTEAQSASCGDYFTAPSSWPYITGDIQWTNLNFTYGTIEIQAMFPSVNTSLWPATWLLGSNCQYTNPLTGSTGITINGHTCPNIGSSGYTEIDMTECYGSNGWCQFHVANPSFGKCDANYTVDTNWHTFTTVWSSSSITQSMDGVSRATCNQKLSNPMFLLIQTQTGGVGGTPHNSFLPAELLVNYVKVTQP